MGEGSATSGLGEPSDLLRPRVRPAPPTPASRLARRSGKMCEMDGHGSAAPARPRRVVECWALLPCAPRWWAAGPTRHVCAYRTSAKSLRIADEEGSGRRLQDALQGVSPVYSPVYPFSERYTAPSAVSLIPLVVSRHSNSPATATAMTTILRRLLRAAPAPAPAPASLSSHLPFSTRSRRTPHRFRRSRRGANPAPPSPDAVSAAIMSLPSRLTPPVLASFLASTSDARLLLPLLTHSLHLPTFRPDPSPFLVAIKRLATADLYADFDRTCALSFSLLPSLPSPGSLLRNALYFYCQFGRLGKAFHVYTLMRASADPAARPSADTYYALFTALLSRGGGDTLVHYMYMDNVSALFRQMLEEGIPPDTRTLNVLIRGYAQSLHLNDALRLFHQMRPLYGCEPDAFTYSYLVHGLSAQGRTRNARELFDEMRGNGLLPTEPACNAFVGALAMAGEAGDAERVMWEMARAGRVVDDITRRALVEELSRTGKREDADRLAREMEQKGIVSARELRALLSSIRDDGDDNLDMDDRGRNTW